MLGDPGRKVIMYHATSSVFLRDILKHGLVSNPKQRVWTEESPFGLPYIGVYLSTSLDEVLGYAWHPLKTFGGMPTIIVCEIELATIRATDEDYIDEGFNNLNFCKDKHMQDLYIERFIIRKLSRRFPIDNETVSYLINNRIIPIIKLIMRYLCRKNQPAYYMRHDPTYRYLREALSEYFGRLYRTFKDKVEKIGAVRVDKVSFKGANRIIGIITLNIDKENRILCANTVYQARDKSKEIADIIDEILFYSREFVSQWAEYV